MTAKADVMLDYFTRWGDDLDRAKSLLEDPKYCLEGWLVLSCHIGALASLRFPTLRDNERYKLVVLEYSTMRPFYEEIDLLFFLQWPKSDFSTHGDYLKLKSHTKLATQIEAAFGDEHQIRTQKRYVSPVDFMAAVGPSPFPGFDGVNLQQYLPLFSNVELLYRFVRCLAVHSLRFPFVTRVHLANDGVRYDDNHAITRIVLYQTVANIVNNLRSECVGKSKWPWEL